MPTLLGQEGGTQKVTLLTKPFYLSVRSPVLGRKRWVLRVSISSPVNFGVYLSRASDSGLGGKFWKTGLGHLAKH